MQYTTNFAPRVLLTFTRWHYPPFIAFFDPATMIWLAV